MPGAEVTGPGSPLPGPVTRTFRWLRSFLRPTAEGEGLIAAAPSVPLRRILRRLGPLLRGYRLGIVVLLVMAAALPAIETIEIWLFQRVVDDVLVPMTLQPLVFLAALYVGLSLTSGLLSWIDTYVSTWVGEHLTLDVRRRMLARIHQAPLADVDRTRSGDMLTRITADAGSVQTLLLGGIVDGVGTIARLVFFTVALLLLDWQLALVSFVVAPVFWWVSQRFARRIKRVARERRRRAGSMASVADESVASLALVQVHGRAAQEEARFEREGRAIVVAELAAARLRATYPIVIDLLELLGLLVVVGLGTWALADSRLTLGGLLVFLTYLSQLYKPIHELGELGVTLVSAAAGVDRVVEVLDLPAGLADRPGARPLAEVRGELAMRSATYTYPGAHRPAVAGVALAASPGTITVLTGPSGSGKSTVTRLACRLVDPDSGVVCLDGHDLRDLPLSQVRDSVTVLLQEAPVLDASVRDNVAFSRPDADVADIWEALRRAGAAGFVRDLPDGLDTALGRAGRSLSGGQRQRIALARALLTDAKVLVMDEPTTGLDAEATSRLLATLRDLAADRCVLIATHDQQVVAHADAVVDLQIPLQLARVEP